MTFKADQIKLRETATGLHPLLGEIFESVVVSPQNTPAATLPFEDAWSFYEKDNVVHKKWTGQKIYLKQNQAWLEAYVPFDKKGWVDAIRQIPGRKWDKEKTCWIVPYVQATLMMLDQHIGASNLIFDLITNDVIPRHYTPENNTTPNPPLPPSSYVQINHQQKEALNRTEEQLILRQLSSATIRDYRVHLTSLFCYHKDIDPAALDSHHVQGYLLHQIRHKKIAASTQNQIINAYKAYVEKVLKKPKEWIDVPRPKEPKYLPNVLSEAEIIRLIKAADNIKHQLILLVIYSAGLRLSELINLRVRDISTDRRIIFIKNGKGKKDRYVTMADTVIPYLNKYKLQYRPTYWLFVGQQGGQYSPSSVQKIFQKAVEKAQVNAYATVHTLRHSHATHCVENGFSLALIQEALGHESLKTTERYLHVSSQALSRLKSPLDILAAKGKDFTFISGLHLNKSTN